MVNRSDMFSSADMCIGKTCVIPAWDIPLVDTYQDPCPDIGRRKGCYPRPDMRDRKDEIFSPDMDDR